MDLLEFEMYLLGWTGLRLGIFGGPWEMLCLSDIFFSFEKNFDLNGNDV